jgi:predicted permease
VSWWSRLANVFRTDRVNRDLDEELRLHVEERTHDLIADGMSRDEAQREASRRLGNALRLRDASRDARVLVWLDSLVRDGRLGLRLLRKHAVVTAAVVLSLALALGACLAAFALIDALILRPLPVRDPGRLVYLSYRNDTPGQPDTETFNDPLFVRLREAGRGTVDLFAVSTQVMRDVTFDGSDAEGARTQFVSGDAFERFGIVPAVGRVIGRGDDETPGASPVAVLSHAFWTRRFGGDPHVVGRSFAMDGRTFQIVGVARAGFEGVEPGRPTDVWLPYAMYSPRAFGNPQFNWFRILGYVGPGVSMPRAQSVLQTAFSGARRERVGQLGAGRSPEAIARYVSAPLFVRPAANGPSPLRAQFGQALWMLGAIAGLVLLIAGSNVTNLQLARTATREREMALRLSIGAGRARLIQQLLVENALVALAACALALAFARSVAPWIVGMLASADDPIQLDLHGDWRFIVGAIVLTVMTTMLSGLVPALRASRVAPVSALKADRRAGGVRASAMRPFVAAQIAFGLVVLFLGNLFLQSFTKLTLLDPGFSRADVLVLSLDASRVTSVRPKVAVLDAVDRVQLVPGVSAAGAALVNVLGRALTFDVGLPGTPPRTIDTTVAPVGPGFFDAMGMSLRTGRALTREDMEPDRAIVVNETFARAYFGDQPAVGRLIDLQTAEAAARPHEIVGVVADARYDLRRPAAPTIYEPLRLLWAPTIYVRVSGDPQRLVPVLRDVIRAATPTLGVTAVASQADLVGRTLVRERLLAMLSTFFALVGLVLVGVGLYGVLTFTVVQRTREIGIRTALGARPSSTVWTVVADLIGAMAIGLAAGLAGGLYTSRFVEAFLFDVTPFDLSSLAWPVGVFFLAAIAAAAWPARRAARVDPVIALRAE